MNTNTHAPQQLTLPVESPVASPAVVVPLQFRVSEATARRGLQHVAELRRLLADRQAAREAVDHPAPVLHRTAA